MGWSAIDQISRSGIQFLVGIILARLLSPDEYGLIGILTIFTTIFIFICDSGFTIALVRKKEVQDEDYSTVFYINLVLSIIMSAALFFSAPLIATFFKRPELVSLTQVMSSIVIINALGIVQRARLTKAINFKTQTKITLISTISSGVVGISMAYSGYGVWSLVGQQITSQSLNTILLWINNKWLPKLVFSIQSFREMWAFGWKLLVSGLIDSAWTQIYQVVVGKFYAPETLGLYTRAKQFSQMFSTNLTNVVQRVSFPVLSSIQNDRERLKKAYQRVIRATMLPTFVLMFGMAACAKPMILFLIGEKWIGCVGFLQIICIYGSLYPLHAINLNMLQVQGRSDLFLKLEIIKKCISVGPILLGVFVDIYMMVVGSLVVSCISYYLNAYYSGPYLNYSIKDQIMDILPSFFVAVIMAVPVYIISYLPLPSYILFPIQIISGAIIVITICELKKLPEYIELKNIVSPYIMKIMK